jgi:hypothetical protein
MLCAKCLHKCKVGANSLFFYEVAFWVGGPSKYHLWSHFRWRTIKYLNLSISTCATWRLSQPPILLNQTGAEAHIIKVILDLLSPNGRPEFLRMVFFGAKWQRPIICKEGLSCLNNLLIRLCFELNEHYLPTIGCKPSHSQNPWPQCWLKTQYF